MCSGDLHYFSLSSLRDMAENHFGAVGNNAVGLIDSYEEFSRDKNSSCRDLI